MSASAKQVAIITGASGGLGKEFVKQVIDDVDEIWAVGRNVQKLEGLKAEFGGEAAKGAKIVPLQMDLSDTKAFSKLSDKIKSEEKNSAIQIRWLINNAGAGRFGASKDFSAEEISVSVNAHCAAVASLCNICIPYMKAGDHIVNVSSQSAFSPLPYMNLYAATKAFVYSYTRALGEELRESGIVVTAVCPGWIKTALLPDSLNGRKVKFPLIVTADKVAAKAIKDARRGKPLSVCRFAVRVVAWFQRHASNDFSVKFWARSVKKYL